MKKTLMKLVVLAGTIGALTFVGGCSKNQKKSAVVGTLIGAGLGAGIGGLVGKNVGGALIGAGVGGISGAIVGNAIAENEESCHVTDCKKSGCCSCTAKK